MGPLSPLEEALRAVAADLAHLGVSWALVGGLAVSARAEPRTTRDVDVAVAVEDDAGAEALVRGLQATGQYRLVSVVEQTSAGRLATARLRGPGGVMVDLLFASSGIEAEIAACAETFDLVPGLPIPVARLGHLIALKVLARDDRERPQDFDDLRALLREATGSELARGREAVRKIEARGFARGRDLSAAVEAMIAEFSA